VKFSWVLSVREGLTSAVGECAEVVYIFNFNQAVVCRL
jgi:hypothetical protein